MGRQVDPKKKRWLVVPWNHIGHNIRAIGSSNLDKIRRGKHNKDQNEEIGIGNKLKN